MSTPATPPEIPAAAPTASPCPDPGVCASDGSCGPTAAPTPPGGDTTLDEATRAILAALGWADDRVTREQDERGNHFPAGHWYSVAERAGRLLVEREAAIREVFTARHAAEVAAQRERIARSIEVAAGERCPECGGSPASLKWKHGSYVRLGRCGAGHTWEHKSGDYRNPADLARDHAESPAGSDPLTEAKAYIEALKGERDRLRAALISAEQRGREQAAQAVEAWAATAQVGLARGCLCYGDECSGRCGYGKPLAWSLDPAEAVAIARGATPTPAGGEAESGQPSEGQLTELAQAIRQAARIEGVDWIAELGNAGVGELARALYDMWPRATVADGEECGDRLFGNGEPACRLGRGHSGNLHDDLVQNQWHVTRSPADEPDAGASVYGEDTELVNRIFQTINATYFGPGGRPWLATGRHCIHKLLIAIREEEAPPPPDPEQETLARIVTRAGYRYPPSRGGEAMCRVARLICQALAELAEEPAPAGPAVEDLGQYGSDTDEVRALSRIINAVPITQKRRHLWMGCDAIHRILLAVRAEFVEGEVPADPDKQTKHRIAGAAGYSGTGSMSALLVELVCRALNELKNPTADAGLSGATLSEVCAAASEALNPAPAPTSGKGESRG